MFAQAFNLKRHQTRCKELQKAGNQTRLQSQQATYEIQLQNQREAHLIELRNQCEAHKVELQKQREAYERQIEQLQRKIEKWENEMIEIAKQPSIATTTTNHRTIQIINQLGSYDFDTGQIEKILEENFTEEVFRGGPDKIAEFTVQYLLTDPDTNKRKVICTDTSRRMFRYIDPETQKLQVDPGFQRTHKLIRKPLEQANRRIYCDAFLRNDPDDYFREKWKKNDEFIEDECKFPDKLQQFLKK